MNGPGHDNDTPRVDLATIRAPAVPSKDADERTRGEEQQLDRAAKIGAMKPVQRHIHAVERTVVHLEADKASLAIAVAKLQSELDVLRPKYAALQQARKSSRTVSVVGTLAMGVGGGVASWGGAIDTLPWERFLTGVGLTMVILGALCVFLVQLSGWPKDS